LLLGFLRQRGTEKTASAVEKTRRAWFNRVGELLRRPRLDEGLWDELEELLVSADVGVGATQKLVSRLQQQVSEAHVTQPDSVLDLLKQEMVAILRVGGPSLPIAADGTPLVLLVVGVNGAGKTTSIAKLVQLYRDEGKQVLLGAADTFRAAAIDQLQAWGVRLGVDVVAHQPGADPGAVAFDTLQAARARGTDVVIIDTAGRLHTKTNLMEELKKIKRVLSRQSGRESQLVLLTLDASTGQNGLIQARAFTEAIKCDGVFLAKLDGTAKGGVVVAIADELKLPVLYIGTGEQPEDVASFDPEQFVDAMFDTREPG
jgi:fused signal recognition particle receptor